MLQENKVAPTSTAPARLRHLVCGAGGSRAILGSAGAIMACRMAGITEWKTLGGVSGGSIPSVLLAAGLDPAHLLKFAVEVDFASLVPRHATPISAVIAFLLKDRFEFTRPHVGVLSSEKMGQFIDERVPTWPKNYWTMAAVGRTQVVFTAEGVFQYLQTGERRVLSNSPAPVGLAIRATCAVPGIIDAPSYLGRYLFDGALTWDGQCPVRVVNRHFGAQSADIVACDVGDEGQTTLSLMAKRFWKIVCGNRCIGPDTVPNLAGDGVLMMEPRVDSVRSLQFNLTSDQKWRAVLAGFEEAVQELALSGVLVGDQLSQCKAVCGNLEAMKGLAAK